MDNAYPLFKSNKKTSTGQLKKFLADFKIDCQQFPVINVVGTNGKGSVSHQLSLQLQKHYKQVGLFISPSFLEHNERIQINGCAITDEQLQKFITRWGHIWDQYQLNFFEKWVSMCILYFNEMGVDIAVIEAGIGGQLDSTNCFLNQKAVLLTSVGIDHQDLLGHSLKSIVTNKVKIIHDPATPLFVAANNRSLMPIITKLHHNVQLSQPLELDDLLWYQRINMGLVVKLLQFFKYTIYWEDMTKHPLGRFTSLPYFKNVYIDGAHNLHAIKALMKTCYAQWHKYPVVLLGMAKHKKSQEIIDFLSNQQIKYYLIVWDSPFSWDVAKNHPNRLFDWKTYLDQHPDEFIMFTGSLYFVSFVWKMCKQLYLSNHLIN